MDSQIDRRNVLLWVSIKDFASALHEAFKDQRIQLYHVLSTKADENDIVLIDKFIDGFVDFFNANSACCRGHVDGLNPSVRIRFGGSKTTFIPIGEYVKKADDDTKKSISGHLVTIFGLLGLPEAKPNVLYDPEGAIADLEKSSSREDQMIANIVKEVKSVTAPMSSSSPVGAVQQLMNNGMLQKVMDMTKSEMSDGSVNKKKLIQKMQGMLSDIADSMPD